MKVVCMYLPHIAAAPLVSFIDLHSGTINGVPEEIFKLEETNTIKKLTGNYDCNDISSGDIEVLADVIKGGVSKVAFIVGSYDIFTISATSLTGVTSGALEYLPNSNIFNKPFNPIGIVKCHPITKEYFVTPQQLCEWEVSDGKRYWLTDIGFEEAPTGIYYEKEFNKALWSKYAELARDENGTIGYVTISGVPVGIKRVKGGLAL